jgi:hypothetical protein
MSQARAKVIRMNSEITWYHDGDQHRAVVLSECPRARRAPDPEATALVRFEKRSGDRWVPYDPDPASEVFASAATASDSRAWDDFLGLLPAPARRFLAFFIYERLEALAVATRCPDLLPELEAVPALTAFLAAHVRLRGAEGPRWNEINAVYEHGGIHAVLEWLGLPSGRQTLSVLARLDDPEIPRSLVAPLRSALWEPETVGQLARVDTITGQDLAQFRHPLAA